MKTLLLLLSSLLFLSRAYEINYCEAGKRLHAPVKGPKVCLPCQDGVTFMSEDRHAYPQCHNCTKVNDSAVEIEGSPCNRTHDTEILCKPGYYRYKARNSGETDKCEPCRLCSHPARACEGYHDTVCCQPGDDAVMTSEGQYACKKRPTVCGPGQYFVNASEGECLPCPDGTFMPAHNHTDTKCAKCRDLSGNPTTHAVIGRPCSITSPTLFSCEPGYFRDPLVTSLEIEVTCQPCQKCLCELVQCDMFHDAKCGDPEPIGSISVPENLQPADEAARQPDQESCSRNQNQTGLTSYDQAVATNLFVAPLVGLFLYITLSYMLHLHFKSPSQTTRFARALIATLTEPTRNHRFILLIQFLVTLITAVIFFSVTSYQIQLVANALYTGIMATLFIVEIIFKVYTFRRLWLSSIKEGTKGKESILYSGISDGNHFVKNQGRIVDGLKENTTLPDDEHFEDLSELMALPDDEHFEDLSELIEKLIKLKEKSNSPRRRLLSLGPN